jgi:hypothetical protein
LEFQSGVFLLAGDEHRMLRKEDEVAMKVKSNVKAGQTIWGA